MRMFAAVILFGLTLGAETVVKELTDTQKAALQGAQKKIDEARAEYEKIANGIRVAHGAYYQAGGSVNASCLQESRQSSFIDNKYIVIQTWTNYICSPLAPDTPAAVK